MHVVLCDRWQSCKPAPSFQCAYYMRSSKRFTSVHFSHLSIPCKLPNWCDKPASLRHTPSFAGSHAGSAVRG